MDRRILGEVENGSESSGTSEVAWSSCNEEDLSHMCADVQENEYVHIKFVFE